MTANFNIHSENNLDDSYRIDNKVIHHDLYNCFYHLHFISVITELLAARTTKIIAGLNNVQDDFVRTGNMTILHQFSHHSEQPHLLLYLRLHQDLAMNM